MVAPSEGEIYQINIILGGSEPPIRRTVRLRADTDLYDLHRIIQVVMDWEGYHMHRFVAGGSSYGVDDDFMPDMESEARTTLRQVAPEPGDQIIYEYDFGDGWEHEIELERAMEPEAGVRYPVCVAGENAAPPEDCGGIPGYYMMLEAIEDEEHPDHEEMLEWVGGDFDPASFNPEEANRQLEALR